MSWAALGGFTLGRDWRFSAEITASTFRIRSVPETTPFNWGGLVALAQVDSSLVQVAAVTRVFRRETPEIITLTPPSGWDSWRFAIRLLYPLAVSPPWLATVDYAMPSINAESFSPGTSVQLLAPRPRTGATITYIGGTDGDLLLLDFVSGVSPIQYALSVSPGGFYELPFSYDGGMWGTWSNGTVLVREVA